MPNQSTHTPLQFIFSPFTRRQPSQNWCDFPVYFGSLMQNVFECQHPTIPPSQHQSISLITAWRSPKKKLELSTNIRFMWGVRIPINLNLLVYTPVDHPVDDICCLRWSEGSTKLRRFVSSTSSPTTPFLKRHTFSNPEIWISDISRPFGRYGIYRYMQKFIAMFWVFWTTVVRQSDFWSQCRIDLLPLGSKIAGSHFFSHGKQFQNPEKSHPMNFIEILVDFHRIGVSLMVILSSWWLNQPKRKICSPNWILFPKESTTYSYSAYKSKRQCNPQCESTNQVIWHADFC